MKKPHVVIIMADQLRYDALGKHTPNINLIKEEGVEFQRAYCASPLCVPARGAFFTGKYPNETGCIINPWEKLERDHGLVASGTSNLYQMMEQDWDSWHTGKQHFHHEDHIDQSPETRTHWLSLEKGYQPYLEEQGKRKPGGPTFRGMLPEMAFGTTTRMKRYSIPTIGCYEEGYDYFFDGYITKTSLDALKSRDHSKPFLLNAMYLAPHPPLDIPEPWFSMFTPEEIELPDNVGEWYEGQSPLQLYNLTGVFGSRYSREDWQRIWPVYLGLVGLLDYSVGQIIDELKRQGMYDDTLLVFTSDHGEMLGSHSLWQKGCMYEESVRTPLYIKFPASYQPSVKVTDELVSAIDLFPTICDFLDVTIPEGVSGRSLMPVVEGEKLDRNRVFIQYDGNGARGNFQRSVIEGDYKLIVDLFKDELFLELYCIAKDPQEKTNLAFDPNNKELVCSLLHSLRVHMERTGDLLQISESAYEDFVERYSVFHGG